MKGKVFVVSEFKNLWRDRLSPPRARRWPRIRKNFATRAEAEAERQARELARLQGASGVRLAATRLTDEQLQRAEGAFALIQGKPQALLFYVDFALKNYRARTREAAGADRMGIRFAGDRIAVGIL